MTDVVQQNIIVYDFNAAVIMLNEAMREIVLGLVECRPEGALVILGGAITNIKSFFRDHV